MVPDAEVARSILAWPDQVQLVVDGVPHPLGDSPAGLQDWSGAPVFVCPTGGTLATAGEHRRQALLAVTSELADGRLVLAGRLRRAGSDPCACCDGGHDFVVVDLVDVVLTRGSRRLRIEVGDYANPALQLNPGFLRHSREHLNRDHGDHLRHAVAQRLGLRPNEIGGVQLSRLDPDGAELQWVTEDGAHSTRFRFARPAHDADELGDQLRNALHPGLC